MLGSTETKIDRKKDEIIPHQWIYLFNTGIEIDNNGQAKGYITTNYSAGIFHEKMDFVDDNYVFNTKINIPTDKLYIIGDTDFTTYNILSTMAYIIGNTQPYTKKLSLRIEIQLQRIELKNDKVFRVYVKKYGQTKICTGSEKSNDPIHGEDEITIIGKSQVIETKRLKQNTSNVIKVIKVFGNEENELSETTIKLVLGLYTNAIIDIIEQTLKRVIAKKWEVFL